MKSILVTGIGGVVGQGILRNLRAMPHDFKIIGTNVERVSAGNHLCDEVYQVPFAYDEAYIPRMGELMSVNDIALAIPSTDYEAYYLSLHQSLLPAVVAASPHQVTAFCLDKYLNYEKFQEEEIPFAKSFLPSEYTNEFDRFVVKPREGRGSRNIYVDPPSPSSFGDDYVVQEYLDGPELTTTFYVLQSGDLHGFLTLARELEQGNTSRCEVFSDCDGQIEAILKKMVKRFPFRGSCNIQSRVTKTGVVPFEINCRISGTNSVRSQFGFPDVAYTVQELLLDQQPSPPNIRRGSALRIIMDVIYPDRSLPDIYNRHDEFRIS